MITRLATFALALTATSTQVSAHAGHIANQGHGHDHWLGYVLAACTITAVFGLIAFRNARGAKSQGRR